MPLKLVKGKLRRIPVEAPPTLEHRVERLYLIAHNFNERFLAIEQALAKLAIPATPTKRVRKPKSVAASD